jgi:hypothetical protein
VEGVPDRLLVPEQPDQSLGEVGVVGDRPERRAVAGDDDRLALTSVGRDRPCLVAGVAPDVPFYLSYPPWLLLRGALRDSLTSNTWPQAPAWTYVLHHAAHSLPLVAFVAVAARLATGSWPRWPAAWALHILVDIPTHSRRNWAPQFLWPFSAVTVDGISWPELLLSRIQNSASRRRRA